MEDPVLPVPVTPPEPQEVCPGLCEDNEPGFVCLWLSDASRRAFATDGSAESEVDYRRHRRWSRGAVEEFSEEYTERMPGMMDPSETESLDALMHSICLNLRDEPHRWGWSYLFNTDAGRTYICIKRYAEELCSEANASDREARRFDDAEVVGRIRNMYARDKPGGG
mgnify:CR=1 FL=1